MGVLRCWCMPSMRVWRAGSLTYTRPTRAAGRDTCRTRERPVSVSELQARMGDWGRPLRAFLVHHLVSSSSHVSRFVCAHLTAHAEKVADRIADYNHIVGTLLFPPSPGALSNAPSTIYDSSHLFFFGDRKHHLVHGLSPL